MGQTSILIIDDDLSTRALVEASVDPDSVTLRTARCAATAREALADFTPDLTLLAGTLEDAAGLLVEIASGVVLWLGEPSDPGADLAAGVLARPVDLVALQLALESHWGTAPAAPSSPAVPVHELGGAASRALETERDALLAEVEVLRHEAGQARRELAEAVEMARAEAEAERAVLKDKLVDALAALDTQRRTAEALQKAYGEVEQAHGALLQQHEAMEAETDALAERARDASLLREQVEIAHRDHARSNSELEARLADAENRADTAVRALRIRTTGTAPTGEGSGAADEAGWWQDALHDVTD